MAVLQRKTCVQPVWLTMTKAIFCCLVVKRTWKSTLWCGRSKLHWGQWRWSRLNSWDFPQTWQSITPPGVLSHSLTVCSVLRQRTMDIFLSNAQAIALKWRPFSIAYLSFSHHPCGHILQHVEVDPSILICQVVVLAIQKYGWIYGIVSDGLKAFNRSLWESSYSCNGGLQSHSRIYATGSIFPPPYPPAQPTSFLLIVKKVL